MLAQMGIAIIACLSYNILLGQGGMLSFGHAVYTGLGSYMAIHALNAVSGGTLNIPVSLLPIVGGVAGMGFAILLGWVTTRKSGTPFAMITLGVAELVFAMSLMFSEFFGGEAGVSGNRVAGEAFFGITYGPQIQVYYLIAIYTFVCVALMYAFTQTPLGRILNAVRDNPERVEFRADQGLAAVLGPGLPVHGHVCARWHSQPDHDEPSGGQVWQAATNLGQLPGVGPHGHRHAGRGRGHDRDGLPPAAQFGTG
jgi:hypothetical protein